MKFSKFNLIVQSGTEQCYVFNTLNGSCLEIEDKCAKAVEKKQIDDLDGNTVSLFKRYGIIISDSINEDRIFSYYRNLAVNASDSINSTVLLTLACNMKCVYCFEGANKKTIFMNKDEADKYIRFISSLAMQKKSNNIFVNLFGGEPMLNIEIGYYILEELLAFSKKNNIRFGSSIITNGTLIGESEIDRLISLNCRYIQITLDGTEEIHNSRRMYKDNRGSFSDIVRALCLLNRNASRIRTTIRINVDKDNLLPTKELLKYIGASGVDLTNCFVDFGIVRSSEGGCPAYSANCLVDSEIGTALGELWACLEKEGFKNNVVPSRRWIYCGLYNDCQYTVAPNCDVYKCWELVGSEHHRVGVLNAKGELSNIAYALYDWMTVDPLKNAECSKCVYLPSCGGGCAITSLNSSGTYHSNGCFKIKGVVEQQVLQYIEAIKKVRSSEHS